MTSRKPLEGYLVADFTSVVAGPWCTRLLADCGARVIKVETPGMGDVLRFSEPAAEGQSRVFAHFNCGKESLALDLKDARGLAAARGLVEKADIVVENFRPGVMKRLGLDYTSVSTTRPDLIYCSISGFGQSGPQTQAPAYAPVVQALCGFDRVWQLAQENEDPLNSAIMVADFMAAAYAFGAIQSAVVHRERFGEGAWLDVTLMESMVSMVAIQCQEAQWESDIRSVVFRPVAARDGHVMIPLVSHRNYLDLLAEMRHPLAEDSRLRTFAGTLAARGEILKALSEWAKGLTTEEIITRAQKAGVPCGRYRTPAEVLSDPNLAARSSFTMLEDAKGQFAVGNAPFRFGSEPFAAGTNVARLGENTDSILAELGLAME